MKPKNKYKKLIGRPAVIDANVIIDLMELNSLFLLNQLFKAVVIPQDTITSELDSEIKNCLNNIDFEAGIINSEQGYNVYSECLARKSLSHCDRMAISIAAENNFILCTNEKPARAQAEQIGLDITGTLGILAAAYQNGNLNKKQTIKQFRDLHEIGSCYVSIQLIEEILSELGLLD